MFSIVNLARHLDIHAEDILRRSNKKFVKRFKKVEQELESKVKLWRNLVWRIWTRFGRKKKKEHRNIYPIFFLIILPE
ncbi:hypothetical protein Ct9H90mP29_08990 [bacterium]|nr:MAG: hypothetical protein Ct9H90mP29_08990 [bacterium]